MLFMGRFLRLLRLHSAQARGYIVYEVGRGYERFGVEGIAQEEVASVP